MGSVIEKYLSEKNKNIRVITTVAVIITAILAIAGGYDFIRSNIWVPKVEVVSVNFDSGICVLRVRGEEKTLTGDDTVFAGGPWGVRFGTLTLNGDQHYHTVEMVKDGMVYKTLSTRSEITA